MSTLSEQNKAIPSVSFANALRFAKEAWGNVALWDQVWDELVASDMIWYFAVGLNRFVEPRLRNFTPICTKVSLTSNFEY
jgi:hypothetical protein